MAISTHRPKHWTRIEYECLIVEDALRRVFGAGWTVRAQGPIGLDADSEPEPDIAVVPGGRRDHSRAHPSRPVLIVDVADSSLEFDRHAPYGHRYSATMTMSARDAVSPLAAPTAAILVADRSRR